MDARAKTVREILHSGDQYLIPFFQRFYSWDKKHWKRILDDLDALVEMRRDAGHFLGPLVCTPTEHVPGEVTPYQLIDGQQRLTTLTLMLCALRELSREEGLNDLAEEIEEDYLVHKRRKGLQRYKIVPRIGDREALLAIVDGKELSGYRDLAVFKGLQYFRREIRKAAGQEPSTQLPTLFASLTSRMSLVVITITGENPYEIFESLNSTGLPLEQSDLIRNYLFMQVPLSEQEDFNEEHWQPYENSFDAQNDWPAMNVTSFYRDYLARLGDYSKKTETYVDFKAQNRERGVAPEMQVAELQRFAKYESYLQRRGACPDPELQKCLSEIALLDVTTAHPLLLNLLDRFFQGTMNIGEIDPTGAEVRPITHPELIQCLEDLSSFVIPELCTDSA